MSFLLGLLLAAIPGTAALLLPALGELITERAGVVNLGTEGAMLSGALTSVLVTLATGSCSSGWLPGSSRASPAVSFMPGSFCSGVRTSSRPAWWCGSSPSE